MNIKFYFLTSDELPLSWRLFLIMKIKFTLGFQTLREKVFLKS